MLCAAFFVFLAGLIYFRQELLLSFGLKGLACWLGSFIGGHVLFSFVWLPGTIGWDIVVPILFFLIARVWYNRLHSPSIICPENMWELEKATRERAANRSSKSPGLSFQATSNTIKLEPTTKTKRPDRWTLIGLRGSLCA